MKRLFAMIFAILLLAGCAADPAEPVEQTTAETEAVTEEATEQTTQELTEEEVTAPAETDAPPAAPHTIEIVEGLVEDTVGYSFEIPVFEYAGNETIRRHYDELVSSMIGFTTEVVYSNAMERGCIVSVYGTVKEATVIDDVLTVSYLYICDYSDSDEPTEESRVDRFDITTGEIVEY